mgnify:FL=1|jgi:circadian clock protein KaiC
MVLKMRGSPYDEDSRAFSIAGAGLHLGEIFRSVTGLPAGNPRHMAPAELERLDQLFQPGQG